MTVTMQVHRPSRETTTVPLTCRVDTSVEATWLRHGGILPNALRTLAEAGSRSGWERKKRDHAHL